jgi:hypothetical protein
MFASLSRSAVAPRHRTFRRPTDNTAREPIGFVQWSLFFETLLAALAMTQEKWRVVTASEKHALAAWPSSLSAQRVPVSRTRAPSAAP